MKYNFDEVVDRAHNYAAKYEEAVLHYGTNDIIPLWIADMDFKTAPQIVEAIQERAQQGIFGYTYRPEMYWEAIRDWNIRRNNHEFDTNCMAFAPGVVPAMRMLVNQLTEQGDKMIIMQPVYHPFADIINNTGRELVVSPLKKMADGSYEMDYQDFEEKVKNNDVKIFLLCNPHNPAGRVWTREELTKIGDICVKYGVEIFSDEIHSDLMLDGHKHTCMGSISPEVAAITTTFTAPSKTFNLAGLQSATVIFNNVERKDNYVAELKKMDIARNNCFSLVATMTAYTHCEDWLDELCAYLSDNMRFIRSFCESEIPELKPSTPEATYLNWIDCSGLGFASNEEIIEFCVKEAGIAPGKGAEFGIGGEQYIRINAACPHSTLEKAFTQLREAIKNR